MSDAQEMQKEIDQKQLFSKEKIKKLVFSCIKKDRKTELYIYTDGTIKVVKPSYDGRLHIPSRLYNWIVLPQTKNEQSLLVWVDFAIGRTQNKQKWYKNVLCEIYHDGFGGCLRPVKQSVKARAIRKRMVGGEILCGVIPGYVAGKKQLVAKEQFYKAKKLVETTDLSKVDNSKVIIYFDHRGTKVAIYQDKQEVYIKVSGRLADYGQVRLSNYLEKFIKNWFDREELFVASKNGEIPIVVPSRIQKRAPRNGRRQLSKELNFPYWGEIKEVEVLFSRPKIELTPQAIRNHQLRRLLQKAECSIKGFVTDVWTVDMHKQKKFALTVKKLLEDAFSDQRNTALLSEVSVITDPSFKTAYEATKHCFDGMIIDGKGDKITVFLYEIISSLTSNKNRVVDTEIASLLHFKNQIGGNCKVILIINGELTTRGQRVVTREFGVSSGVILLGKSAIAKLASSPQQLLETIQSFQDKREELTHHPAMLVHPLSGAIVHKDELTEEAGAILYALIKKKRLERSLIADYCILMGISVNDFYQLYAEGLKEQNNQIGAEWLSNERREKLPEQIIKNASNWQKGKALFYIHYKLVTEASTALLSIKPTLNNLIPYKELLSKLLPIGVRIGGTKKHNNEGADYEQLIKQQLEAEGFTAVTANVLFYYSGRTFELDLIAIKDGELLLASCKDRRDITHQWQAEAFIKMAANILEFRKKILNATNARLYVKSNPEYSNSLKEKYHNKYWVERVKVILTD